MLSLQTERKDIPGLSSCRIVTLACDSGFKTCDMPTHNNEHGKFLDNMASDSLDF